MNRHYLNHPYPAGLPIVRADLLQQPVMIHYPGFGWVQPKVPPGAGRPSGLVGLPVEAAKSGLCRVAVLVSIAVLVVAAIFKR